MISGTYGRMNSSTDWDLTNACREWLNVGVATRWRLGSLRVASTRSLSGPLRVTARRRSWIVGFALATSGRRSRRNGASSFVAGLDAATSGSRSSSVARRLTNVVFARRRVSGSSVSA